MKSTSYGTEILCSLWCCHLKFCDVHISTCSVLFPAIFPSSLPPPHCCQAKPWVPVQSPGTESWFPFIRTHRGEKNPYFSSESFSQPRLLERSTVHVMCNEAVLWGQGKWLCQGRSARTCGSLHCCCFAISAHSFSLGYLIRWTREKT